MPRRIVGFTDRTISDWRQKYGGQTDRETVENMLRAECSDWSEQKIREWIELLVEGVKRTRQVEPILEELCNEFRTSRGIKPCPFCGQDPDYETHHERTENGEEELVVIVHCETDGCIAHKLCWARLEDWNKRVEPKEEC